MDEELLHKAIGLVQSGDKSGAVAILREIVTKDTKNENAWLWLAACFDKPENRIYCLQNVLKINPDNQKAKQALEKLMPTEPSLEELVTDISQKSARAQEATVQPKAENELVSKQRSILLIISAILLLILLVAPVWNTSADDEVSMKVIGEQMKTHGDLSVQAFTDYVYPISEAAIQKYNLETQVHNAFVMLCVTLVVAELILSRITSKHIPKITWVVLGILLLVYPFISLLISWNLLEVPGMIGTIIGATLFIVGGVR